MRKLRFPICKKCGTDIRLSGETMKRHFANRHKAEYFSIEYFTNEGIFN